MNKPLIILSGAIALVLFLPPVREFFIHQTYLRPLFLIILASALTFTLTPLVMKLALRFKAMDLPSDRKVHIEPTPRWGGLALFTSFALVTIYNFDFSLAQKGVAVGGALLVGVGLLDDKFGLPAKIRLMMQLIASGIAIWAGARISFLPDLWWGDALEILLSVVWFVGLTNAMNFLDGMDGLCTGLSAINSFFFAAVAVRTHQSFFMFLSAVLCGACLGFLPYNFRKNKPALIFLGDTGSTFLGFTLAGIALTGDWAKDNLVAIIVPIIILAIPIFDISLTTFTRIYNGQVRNISEWLHFTGKDHLHHRIADMGFGKRRTVQVIHLLAVCLGVNAFILKNATIMEATLLLIETAVLFILLGFVIVYVNKQYENWAKTVSHISELVEANRSTHNTK